MLSVIIKSQLPIFLTAFGTYLSTHSVPCRRQTQAGHHDERMSAEPVRPADPAAGGLWREAADATAPAVPGHGGRPAQDGGAHLPPGVPGG